MCKPGSACCGCATSSSGIGLAVGVVAVAGATSMAATLISDILTAVLVSVLSVAAGGSIMLVVILRRTRGVVTWPPGRARPARSMAGPPARGLAGPPARPAMTASRPLAITAPGRLRIVTRPGSPGLIRPGEPLVGETATERPSDPAVLAARH
jgi:hypothetical protein